MDKYLIGLSCLECLGSVNLNRLLLLFSTEELWTASFLALKKRGVPSALAEKIIQEKKEINLEKILDSLEKEKIKTVALTDQKYPALLKEIYAPPLLLFYRGNADCFNQPVNLAVVGSRKISGYCQIILPKILNAVLNQKTVIISGLALGVDGLAHQSALEAGSPTIGVLAGGLEWQNFYPMQNLRLAKNILASGGLVMSENPPTRKSYIYNFPKRNRLIAGLAQAVLIAEAAGKSGALITADYALDFNRDVLALPQNINSANAAGVNRLIKNGARLITEGNDLLDALHLPLLKPYAKAETVTLNAEEKIIYNLLTSEPTHVDKIILTSRLETARVNSLLMELEIKELIKNIGGQNYLKL